MDPLTAMMNVSSLRFRSVVCISVVKLPPCRLSLLVHSSSSHLKPVSTFAPNIMSAVKDMIAKLDAAKLQEEADRVARIKAAEEAHKKETELTLERQRMEKEEEERQRKKAMEEERLKWKVDEEESARDVLERKKQFLEAQKKPEVKVKKQLKNIPTIVLDLGSGMIKAGFAGEDAPRWMFNAVVGSVNVELMDLEKHAHIKRDFYVGDAVWAFPEVLTIRRVIKRGVIQDWDDFEKLLEYLFLEEMKLTPEELMDHPVLCTENPFSPKANRERLGALLFERFRVPAVFIANTSSLAVYSTGQLCGVVVDIGYNVSTSVAVYDGDVLPRTLFRLNVGGAEIDTYLCKLLNERGYNLNEKRVFDSFLIRDLKERLCYVAADYEAEKLRQSGTLVRSAWARSGNANEVKYDVTAYGNDMLPGYAGRTVPDAMTIGPERYQCGFPWEMLTRAVLHAHRHSMVQETIKACPIDITKTMYGNIILAGGTTMLPGFADRLRKELQSIAAASVVINVLDLPTRHIATWIGLCLWEAMADGSGGSVLASTHNFNPHWVSRDEYLRYGPDLLHGPL